MYRRAVYYAAAAGIGIAAYSVLVSPLSPATHSLMGDWQAADGAPMAAAAAASALLLRRVLRRPGRLALALGGLGCALLTAVFYTGAILFLEGLYGGDTLLGAAEGLLVGCHHGPILLVLSAHVSVPMGILGAAPLRKIEPPSRA